MDTKYIFGPATIFTGQIPGLDANFINPMDDKSFQEDIDINIPLAFRLENGEKIDTDGTVVLKDFDGIINELCKNNGYTSDKEINEQYFNDTYTNVTEIVDKIPNIETDWFKKAWEGNDGKIYVCISTVSYTENFNAATMEKTQTPSYSAAIWRFDKIEQLEGAMENVGQETEISTKTLKSSAGQLRGAIATWYKALRLLATVGLLSVLVYVGIRIITSSTGQEKAKYKNMIKDWLVAIILLFVLHYIMAFTMQITEQILNIFNNNSNIIGANGQDVLMSSARRLVGDIDDNANFAELFAEITVYVVLVIFTLIFVVQYLKRVVMLAFLTMIAPLITLTYPIDKIKDGQAQAFSMWIREYIFNALLPVIHIIIYYMLIGSALEFITVGDNYLYAIVAVGFLVPAEKFFRKMFGFDKASSVGQLGAAAGGALIMNAINKMGHKGGSRGGANAGAGGGTTSPRMNRTGFVAAPSGSGEAEGDKTRINSRNVAGAENQKDESEAINASVNSTIEDGKFSLGNSAKAFGRQINPFTRQNASKNLKTIGRGARKVAVGAAGAATLGTLGFAAGVSTGDVSSAFKYGAVGAGAGYLGANSIGDKLTATEKKTRETILEGGYGTEEYNKRKSIYELTRDTDFNKACRDAGIKDQAGRDELIRKFHSNGITKPEDIKKAMIVQASNPGTSTNKIILAQMIRQQATSFGMKKAEMEQSLREKGLSNDDVKSTMDLIAQL